MLSIFNVEFLSNFPNCIHVSVTENILEDVDHDLPNLATCMNNEIIDSEVCHYNMHVHIIIFKNGYPVQWKV